MIRLIVFLAIAIALSLLAAWLADHPGRAALTWGGTHIETSVAVLVIGVLLLGVVLTILFEIFRLIRGAPRAARAIVADASAPRRATRRWPRAWSRPRPATRTRPRPATAAPTGFLAMPPRPCC